MSAPEAAPAAHNEQVVVARPRDNVRTGTSAMSAFAAHVAAQGIIEDQSNEPDDPTTMIRLSAVILQEFFARHVYLIIRSVSREMGYPNLTALANADLIQMANSVAFICVSNCYLVTYNKGIQKRPVTFGALNRPNINYSMFPVHITSLINSIGPIQPTSYPTHRWYIPLIHHDDVNLARPNNYDDNLVNRFFEKIVKTKYITANVEPRGTESSAWWALWPVKGARSTMTDTYRGLNSTETFQSVSLFSPRHRQEILNEHIVCATLLPAPLNRPGMAHHSATRFYEIEELERFVGTPTINNFPVEARSYPYYDTSYRAVIHEIESGFFDVSYDDIPDQSGNQVIQASSSSAPAPQVRPLKRRRLTAANGSPRYVPVSPPSVNADGSTNRARRNNNAQDNQNEHQLQAYRIVYYYFEHQTIQDVTPENYTSWPHQLCSPAN